MIIEKEFKWEVSREDIEGAIIDIKQHLILESKKELLWMLHENYFNIIERLEMWWVMVEYKEKNKITCFAK